MTVTCATLLGQPTRLFSNTWQLDPVAVWAQDSWTDTEDKLLFRVELHCFSTSKTGFPRQSVEGVLTFVGFPQ
eukprot:3099312-Amphidinium_carterae.1